MKPTIQLSIKTTALLLSMGAFLLLQSCSTTTRTATASYYPYGTSTYSAVYTPPSWAPSTNGISNIRYYYLPDCDAYYDASNQQFISQENGQWMSSSAVPNTCSGLDLSTAYVVMLNSSTNQPWLKNALYQSNYPANSYDAYGNIVIGHNLISGIPTGYRLTARGFNENTNSVVFAEQEPNGTIYSLQTVPMTSISTYMPAGSRVYYYGGGYPTR